MGATTFECEARGSTAQGAFDLAVKEAQHDYGHSGYTGTIAEKETFVQIPLPEGADPFVYADSLVDSYDERIEDKWGPAGCFDLGDGLFYFFGWASE